MTSTELLRTHDAVRGYVERICFKTGPPAVVGAELEWLVADPARPERPVSLEQLQAAFSDRDPPPAGSTITFEPGGQLELSSPPTIGLTACWQALSTDLAYVTEELRSLGLRLLPTAIDPHRLPVRQLHAPRYDAMETYYDRRGGVGRMMMCSTAAIQVNLDAGADAADVARRWRLLNTVGPVFVAAFANSPTHAGMATGWKSTRQAVWQQLDPPRTSSPVPGADPALGWAEYALDAPVMVRRNATRWHSDPGITFRQWVDGARPVDTPPTKDDLAYHLTTLFPPVRPRGWFEVRYVDAQSPQWWPVPIAVLTALADTRSTGDLALTAAGTVAGAWHSAARRGLADPRLALAALRCFQIAADALNAQRAHPGLVALVENYLDRYVMRGRCPADDALDHATSPSGTNPAKEEP